MSCCPPGSIGFAPLSTSVPKGKVLDIAPPKGSSLLGMTCYWTGASLDSSLDYVVVIFSDVYGMETGNHKTFADSLAERLGSKAAVVMPDLFRGNPIMQPWFPSLISEMGGSVFGAPGMLYRIKINHPPEVIERDLRYLIVPWLAERVGDQMDLSCVGFCFGGWVVGRALSMIDLPFKAGVGIHPSFKPELMHLGTEQALAERIGKKPLLLLPAWNDDLKPNNRVVQIMAEARGVPADEVSIEEFNAMRHGWVSRGDSTDTEVAKNQDRALELAANFIMKYSNHSE